MIIEYKKQCKCDATASGPRPTYKSTWNEETHSVQVTITYNLGPVCDKCYTPWKRTK